MPCCATPMIMPPRTLMKVMSSAAMASPRTNFEAPSMAPVEGGLVLERLAALARGLLVDEPGREVGVDRHLLARHGVEREARRDLGDAPRAFRDDDEVHDDQDREHDDADDEVARHHEMAEGLDD